MRLEVFTAQAFCYNGKGGNGAGIVLEPEGLSKNQKMWIAKEMGYSETVFVGKSENADYKLEYFTPADEVELCGHATIATFVLIHQKIGATGKFTIETKAGILDVEVESDGKVLMQQRCPEFFEQYDAKTFANCLPYQYHHKTLPIEAVSTGLKDILFPVDNIEHLRAMQPNFEAMAQLNKGQGVVGIHAFALTANGEHIAECRNFAPLYDIDEESATGTSNCALACYLHKHHTKLKRYRFIQGVSMNQPSEIEVKLEGENEITKVMVGGRGIVTHSRLLEL